MLLRENILYTWQHVTKELPLPLTSLCLTRRAHIGRHLVQHKVIASNIAFQLWTSSK